MKQLLVKTIGSKPDVTPVCSNETQNPIMLIVCKIRTERSKEECHLLYRDNLVNECDSRFRLVTENQTVFLHLTSLKPEDGGNYICQCSHSFGTSSLHLNVTVEGKLRIFLFLWFTLSSHIFHLIINIMKILNRNSKMCFISYTTVKSSVFKSLKQYYIIVWMYENRISVFFI